MPDCNDVSTDAVLRFHIAVMLVVRQCEVLYTCELLEIWSRRERSTPLHDRVANVRRHASLLRQIRRKQRGGRILQGLISMWGGKPVVVQGLGARKALRRIGRT